MSDAAFQDAVAASLGAVTSTLCTYPLDVAKTRLQAQRRSVEANGEPRSPKYAGDQDAWKAPRRRISGPLPYAGPVDCLRRIVHEEGALQLFVGLRPSMAKAAMTNFIYFYLLRAVKHTPLGRSALVQGMSAGVGVQLLVLPIDMIVTRLQSMRRVEGDEGGTSWLKVLLEIVRQRGLLGLWSGLGPGLLLTLNPGITQMVLARFQPPPGAPISAVRAFWSAALAKAIAGSVTYPYMRAKVQMQVEGCSGAPATVTQVLAQIVGESGMLAIFDGLAPQLTNGVLKEAILNTVRLKIAHLVAQVFGLLRARSKVTVG